LDGRDDEREHSKTKVLDSSHGTVTRGHHVGRDDLREKGPHGCGTESVREAEDDHDDRRVL